MENKKYNANNLKILKGLEPVRDRPGMYIGTTDVTGLHHLIWEILDNAVDEANAGFGKKIEVDLNADGSVTVSDEGRGVPWDMNKKEGVSGFDIVYRTLHGGGKFNEDNYKTAGGLHGVGGAVVNALSTFMEIHSFRDGTEHMIRYSEGGSKETPTKLVGKTDRRGTVVTFKPDPTIFDDVNFNYDTVAAHMDDQACLTKGVTFVLKDNRTNQSATFFYKEGLKEFFQRRNATKTPLVPAITIEGSSDTIRVEVVFGWFKDEYSQRIYSFANGVRTPEGGHHEAGFKKAITSSYNAFASSHKLLGRGNVNLDGDDIREGMCAIISVWVPETILQFEGQTKSKLGTKQALPAVDSVVENFLGHYLEEHSQEASDVIEKALESREARQKAAEAREKERNKFKSGIKASMLSGKLAPPASKDYKSNELFIVEGNSAGGSAKNARDRIHQGILPLRGKPKNTVDVADADSLLDNKELADLINTIGAGYDDNFNLKNIHYGKVIIMTDADDDGFHIRNLLLAFFYEHMRPLVESGHVYVACPPLYRVYKDNHEIYCWDDAQLDEARKKIGKGYDVSRYKGLGEMSPEQLSTTTMNPPFRKLLKVVTSENERDECADHVRLFMGKDSDRRKEWIQSNIDFGYKADFFERLKKGQEFEEAKNKQSDSEDSDNND